MEEPEPVDRNLAAQRVRAPAIALIVTGALGALGQLASLGLLLLGSGMNAFRQQFDHRFGELVVSNVFWGAQAVVGIGVAAFLVWGALRMMSLESWPIAMTVCILAIVPCFSPCCVLGLPFGIWGLVVILEPDVKRAFR